MPYPILTSQSQYTKRTVTLLLYPEGIVPKGAADSIVYMEWNGIRQSGVVVDIVELSHKQTPIWTSNADANRFSYPSSQP